MADIKYYDVIKKPVITEKSMNAMAECEAGRSDSLFAPIFVCSTLLISVFICSSFVRIF